MAVSMRDAPTPRRKRCLPLAVNARTHVPCSQPSVLHKIPSRLRSSTSPAPSSLPVQAFEARCEVWERLGLLLFQPCQISLLQADFTHLKTNTVDVVVTVATRTCQAAGCACGQKVPMALYTIMLPAPKLPETQTIRASCKSGCKTWNDETEVMRSSIIRIE